MVFLYTKKGGTHKYFTTAIFIMVTPTSEIASKSTSIV